MSRLEPTPRRAMRRQIAEQIRNRATQLGRTQIPILIQLNNQESELVPPIASFTKSLTHDEYGIVDQASYTQFVTALNAGFTEAADPEIAAPFNVRKHDGGYRLPNANGDVARSYESPLAGHTYAIEGADPDAVAMPPAPKLGSYELTAEMAEVYAMALLRDVPFNQIENGCGSNVAAVIQYLNTLPWFNGKDAEGNAIDAYLDPRAAARRQARFSCPDENLVTLANIFRGSTPGAMTGPYISQFLLAGNLSRQTNGPDHESGLIGAEVSDGFIQYGVQSINQRVVPHLPGVDYMTDWASWLDVQNGANRGGLDQYGVAKDERGREVGLPPLGRFIHTPRDLATYVHFDALYQAYLNACLILLGTGAPTDIGMPEGPGNPTRDGFATFGPPHILTLVTEVATRALKAVRRQKYQIHLRARPEAIGGVLTLANNHPLTEKLGTKRTREQVQTMVDALKDSGLAEAIAQHNQLSNAARQASCDPLDESWVEPDKNLLLPMAFPEGSPVHASYGAGHATVAGACTTILKAFFEMYEVPCKVSRGRTRLSDLVKIAPTQLFNDPQVLKLQGQEADPVYYRTGRLSVNEGGTIRHFEGGALIPDYELDALTIEGELDKLAANISIGRNFAGVHYYTDYYESLRMGERIAVQLLQEHMLTYGEAVSMRFTSFDGDRVMITGTGHGGYEHDKTGPEANVHIWSQDRYGEWQPVPLIQWWNRALDEFNTPPTRQSATWYFPASDDETCREAA